MNRNDLITALQSQLKGTKPSFTKAQLGQMLTALEAVSLEVLSRQNEGGLLPELVLPGMGRFAVKWRAARKGRNPQTGQALDIPKRRVLTFSPAAALKRALNP
jgi:nucleoid DNA-binding protein